jgi:hypothetical protein
MHRSTARRYQAPREKQGEAAAAPETGRRHRAQQEHRRPPALDAQPGVLRVTGGTRALTLATTRRAVADSCMPWQTQPRAGRRRGDRSGRRAQGRGARAAPAWRRHRKASGRFRRGHCLRLGGTAGGVGTDFANCPVYLHALTNARSLDPLGPCTHLRTEHLRPGMERCT